MKSFVQIETHVMDVPDGQARGFAPRGQKQHMVFVVRNGEDLFAWRDACPHLAGAPMAWRRHEYLNKDGTRIVCSAHGAQFDIATGLCTLGPCVGKYLTPVPMRINRHGHITLSVAVGSLEKETAQ